MHKLDMMSTDLSLPLQHFIHHRLIETLNTALRPAWIDNSTTDERLSIGLWTIDRPLKDLTMQSL